MNNAKVVSCDSSGKRTPLHSAGKLTSVCSSCQDFLALCSLLGIHTHATEMLLVCSLCSLSIICV